VGHLDVGGQVLTVLPCLAVIGTGSNYSEGGGGGLKQGDNHLVFSWIYIRYGHGCQCY